MKIEIDFDAKTIEVKDNFTIGELIEKLKEINLQDWESYTLKIGFSYYPIVPYIPSYPIYPNYPIVTYKYDGYIL